MQEEPIAAEAEESELVVAGEVVPEIEEGEEGVVTEPVVASETMEREAPAEGAAEEPRGWLPSLLGPRRGSGAEADAAASEAEIEQAAGEAAGSLEFVGLWKEKEGEHWRLMPTKMQGSADRPNWETGDLFTTQLQVAFGRLVDELVRNKVPSGILAISTSLAIHHDSDGIEISKNFVISWSASPDDESYQRLGLISMQAPQRTNIRFADFDGAIDVSGGLDGRDLDGKDAVYRVTLPSGGLRGKWAGRPPPPAPEALYTGPRDDGLLSTEEISGDYCCFPFCCNSMTVEPLGADMIETWRTCCLFCPRFIGLDAEGEVRTRKPGTNDFGWMTFSAGGRAGCFCKCPGSQKRSFQKVDARDLAGKWCGCECPPIMWGGLILWPLSCFCCTTMKALNEDQYEESGRGGCLLTLCWPLIPVSATRTRQYVNGHPTNGFANNGHPPKRYWYRDPGCAIGGARFAKKVG